MVEATHRFHVRDRVRVKRANPVGNPRTPAYVRGKEGIVIALHGSIVNPLDHHGVYPPRAACCSRCVRFLAATAKTPCRWTCTRTGSRPLGRRAATRAERTCASISLVPAAGAQVGILHRDSAPLPIKFAHHAGTDAGALLLLDIAVDVEARMHHPHVRREKAHVHLRRLAGTRSKRPVGAVQAPHQVPELGAGLAPSAMQMLHLAFARVSPAITSVVCYNCHVNGIEEPEAS
jgi:Nitrile hydratase beta subunit, C-terminal